MPTMQERIEGMKPYFRGIEMYNDALIVRTIFPNKWRVFGSDDEKIKVAQSEDSQNEYFYYADGNESSYDDIFDVIEQTIKINQETTLKLSLLKEKVEELKELFSMHSYEELKNLSFVTNKTDSTKPKRKYTKKKKTSQEALKEENNEEKNEEVDNA